MDRSTFIKQSLSATFLFALFNPVRLLAKNNLENNLPTWEELIDYARWCPTVHNLQPHQIKIISETEAELYYDPKRLLAIGDPDSIFATVALGVFIEHLSIAATPYYKKIEVIEVAKPISIKADSIQLFAKLKLVNSYSNSNIDRSLILKRRTSRLPYNGEALKTNTLLSIGKTADVFNHDFHYSSDATLIDLMIELNQATLFEDLENNDNRAELDRLFRYNEIDAATKKDGLWSKCMGFKGSLMQSVFQHHEKWQHGIRKFFLSNHYKNTFNGTSTLGWFSGKFENTNDWLQAGRMLAISWLSMTKDNAYIQPFGSLITNKKAYEKINEKLKTNTDGKSIWMIFRAGYSKEPARSFRLSTNDIIIK
jgi:hypothetical protein